MLDQNFCAFLEQALCSIFEQLDDEEIKGFWCDGVLLSEPDKYYSQQYVNDNRQVLMTAFVGTTGQIKYELVLQFGNKALSRYTRNLDIRECMPIVDLESRVAIYVERKQIEIYLD